MFAVFCVPFACVFIECEKCYLSCLYSHDNRRSHNEDHYKPTEKNCSIEFCAKWMKWTKKVFFSKCDYYYVLLLYRSKLWMKPANEFKMKKKAKQKREKKIRNDKWREMKCFKCVLSTKLPYTKRIVVKHFYLHL